MDCNYSEPVDYQGNTPATDLTSFQFRVAHCTIQTSTPSSYPIATSSASLEANTFYTAVGIGIIIFLLAIFIGMKIFPR